MQEAIKCNENQGLYNIILFSVLRSFYHVLYGEEELFALLSYMLQEVKTTVH